jgi:hypothetical protein
MSTRANVILKKGERKVYLYRHCDGYPDGLGQDLQEAMDSTPEDTILNILEIDGIELTTGIHGDVEYIYIVNLDINKINIQDEYN